MHYVMSDIHGQHDKFLALLRKIQFSNEDRLFVLGDVIDRGPKPIDTLMHILDADNITLLIGNHEHMMMQCNTEYDLELWMANGASTTLRQLQRLPFYERRWMRERLEMQPVAIPNLAVGGKMFYLVHACPCARPHDSILYYSDLDVRETDRLVWARYFEEGFLAKEILGKTVMEHYRNHYLVIGHTPVNHCYYGKVLNGKPRISKAYGGHLINVDCGCAQGRTLGALRLEDMHEFYID